MKRTIFIVVIVAIIVAIVMGAGYGVDTKTVVIDGTADFGLDYGAGPLVQKYAPTLNAAHQVAQIEASIPLIHTGKDYIGWMQPEVWEGMHQILLEQGLLDKPMDIDEVYTMQFLNKIYGKAE